MDKFITEEEDNGDTNTTAANIQIWNPEGHHMEICLHLVPEIFKGIAVGALDIVATKTFSTARFKLLEE